MNIRLAITLLFLLWLFNPVFSFAGHVPTVVVYDKHWKNLKSAFTEQKFEIEDFKSLLDLDPRSSLCVLNARVREHDLPVISEYVKKGGNIISLGPSNVFTASNEVQFRHLIYDPSILEKEVLHDKMQTKMQFQICNDARKGKRVKWTLDEVVDDAFVSIPLSCTSSLAKSGIAVKIQGDGSLDMLTLKIIDNNNNCWIAFTELGTKYTTHEILFANFMPVSPNEIDIRELDPNHVKQLKIGLARNVTGAEYHGIFYTGTIELLTYSSPQHPSPDILLWKVPLKTMRGKLPEWLEGFPFLSYGKEDRSKVSFTAPELCGTAGGLLDKISYGPQRVLKGTELNIPEAKLAYYGDSYNYATIGVLTCGFLKETTETNTDIVTLASQVLKKPIILDIEPVLDSANYHFGIRLKVRNPLSVNTTATLRASLNNITEINEKAELEARNQTFVTVYFGSINENFPVADFNWDITLTSSFGTDQLGDHINIRRTLETLANHFVHLQSLLHTGQYSRWLYVDSYIARMLSAFGVTQDEPSYSNSATCWADMMTFVQNPNGTSPMGYGMKSGSYYVADLGSIALGMAQLAASTNDGERKSRYLDYCEKYYKWRQSFLITPEKSERLQFFHGKNAKGTTPGTYGIGIVTRDFIYTPDLTPAQKTFSHSWKEERSDWYPLACSLGFLSTLSELVPKSVYLQTLKDDVSTFFRTETSVATGYSAEGVVYAHAFVSDPTLQSQIEGALNNEFLYYFKKSGATRFWFENGARQSLSLLALAYYQDQIASSPLTRGTVLRTIWELNSFASAHSLWKVMSVYPKSTYGKGNNEATMLLAFSSVFLMELIRPGSLISIDQRSCNVVGQ